MWEKAYLDAAGDIHHLMKHHYWPLPPQGCSSKVEGVKSSLARTQVAKWASVVLPQLNMWSELSFSPSLKVCLVHALKDCSLGKLQTSVHGLEMLWLTRLVEGTVCQICGKKIGVSSMDSVEETEARQIYVKSFGGADALSPFLSLSPFPFWY